MRILVGCILSLVVAAGVPPTSMDFHARYGNTDVERFSVRPDLMLTVEYGSDGEACAMRIEPHHGLTHYQPDDPPTNMDEARAVLDEVIPQETRGKDLGPGEKMAGQCYGAVPTTEYENVSINVYYGRCEKVPTERGMDVRFKRPSCESLSKSTTLP